MNVLFGHARAGHARVNACSMFFCGFLPATANALSTGAAFEVAHWVAVCILAKERLLLLASPPGVAVLVLLRRMPAHHVRMLRLIANERATPHLRQVGTSHAHLPPPVLSPYPRLRAPHAHLPPPVVSCRPSVILSMPAVSMVVTLADLLTDGHVEYVFGACGFGARARRRVTSK